jgi:hypothetical protein
MSALAQPEVFILTGERSPKGQCLAGGDASVQKGSPDTGMAVQKEMKHPSVVRGAGRYGKPLLYHVAEAGEAEF